MTNRKIRIKIKATGEIITENSYGNGAVDVKGVFWHKTKYEFMGVLP